MGLMVSFCLLWRSSQQLWACFLGSPSPGGCAQTHSFPDAGHQAVVLWNIWTWLVGHQLHLLWWPRAGATCWQRQDSASWPLCPRDLAVTFCASLWGCRSQSARLWWGFVPVDIAGQSGPRVLHGVGLEGGRRGVSFSERVQGEKEVQCSPSQKMSEGWWEQLLLFSNWHSPLLLSCISIMFFL